MKGSDRKEASLRSSEQSALTRRRERKTSTKIFFGEIRKVLKDLFVGHPGRQIVQNVVHRDTHAANAGLDPALAGLDRDALAVVHARSLRP